VSRDTRIVGERGQITIPKDLRDRFGIRGGDEVVVRAEEDKIVIAQRTLDDRLAEGYTEHADRDRKIAADGHPAAESGDAGSEDADDRQASASEAGSNVPADAPEW